MDIWGSEGLSPLERAAHLTRIRASIRMAYEELGATMQAAMAAAVSSDLQGTARALGVPPAVAVRMATDEHCPDVALLRRALKIIRHRDISVSVIVKVTEAWRINGASDNEIRKVASLLIEIGEECPPDSNVWQGARYGDRLIFHDAVKYARQLV